MRFRTPRVASLAVALGLALAPPAAADLDEEIRCAEAAPAAAEITGVTDHGRAVRLDVRVLLDGVSQSEAEAAFSRAAASYSELKVALAPTYEAVDFGAENDATRLIAAAKSRFGGVRPAGTDLVYVLTSEDIHLGGGYGVAGLADCVGGVRFAHRAFAVGERFDGQNMPFGPFTLYADATAKIAAHEIGHLLGAHHHYANCAQAVRSGDEISQVSPCTVMFNAVDLQAIHFSTANAVVVRGHAVGWADS